MVYPAANRRLYEDIAATGVILSEYPPGTEPKMCIRDRSYTSSVYAVKSGKGILTNTSGWGGGYGNYVVIDHGGGLTRCV